MKIDSFRNEYFFLSNFYEAPITYEGLTYQNNELAEKLLATGDTYLEEGNDWGDRIWGTVNGQGANCLGKILMNTRENLQQKVIEIKA